MRLPKKLRALVLMCCLCLLIIQLFQHLTLTSIQTNSTARSNYSHSPETKCVPQDLQYLTTKYSEKLCDPNHLWSNNYSSLQQLTCKYPTLNPFDEAIVKFMGQSVNRSICVKTSTLQKMFSTDYHSNLITIQPPETYGFFNCCYRVLTPPDNSGFLMANVFRKSYDWITWALRMAQDSRKCYPITTPKQKVTDEFIKIVCYQNQSEDQNKSNIEIVVDFQAFVLPKSKIHKNVPDLDNHLNVAILSLDSISHMNFVRTMPKSYEYIQESLNAFGFFGYNSVNDHTINNMLPLLTGYDSAKLTTEKRYKCPITGPFDNCPFIWKEFASSGYHTIFGEDATFMETFYYSKQGFKGPQTDYYLRPFLLAADAIFGPEHDFHHFPCWAGPRLYFEYLLDYMKSVAVNLGRNNRYFHLLWQNSLSHSFLNRPVAGDDVLLETLTWFKNNNYLNNTVLILMSDHGMRYEGIREILQGKVEAQMPFLFFVLPEWFQKKYPQATKNMRENKYKLVTAFDIHQTLRDLLTMNIEDPDRHKSSTFQFGQSLFLPISNSRDCKEAGVPEEFCSCRNYEAISTNLTRITSVASFVVSEINKKLNHYKQCVKLKEGKVLSSFAISDFQIKTGGKRFSGRSNRKDMFESAFMISLMTQPGNAIFEAEVDVSKKNHFELLGTVKRINKYNNQSHCVDLYEMKSYCFCQDLYKQ